MEEKTLNSKINPWILKLQVSGLAGAGRDEFFIRILKEAHPGIERVDLNIKKGLARIISQQKLNLDELKQLVNPHSFCLTDLNVTSIQDACDGIMRLAIEGMHCRSCELTIERQFRKIKDVEKVDVDAARGLARLVYKGSKPNVGDLAAAIIDNGYKITEIVKGKRNDNTASASNQRPSFWQLAGLFVLVFILWLMFSKSGLIKTDIDLGVAPGFWAVFLLGLVAASSSCIAVSGGLLLSSAAKFNERYGNLNGMARMKPVFLFVVGRLASYGILGGLIGYLGTALSPSPFITGVITIIAALYMLIMGMEMLHLAPSWLKRFLPRMPKFFSRKVMDVEGHEHPTTPFFLGTATFLLPCGFTQALQLYALTTKSAATSAMLLFAFALGTAPSLLALGWASGSLKGKVGKFFFQFSGALVIVFGLWNIQNGFSVAGYPLAWSHLFSSSVSAGNKAEAGDPNVIFDGREQIVRMSVDRYGYTPNSFTIRVGIPTKWVVDGTNAGGCASALQSPKLGIRKLLSRGENIFEFTPKEAGVIPFSCSMGMYRGQFIVVPST